MFKILLILAVGVGVGYRLGFTDAQTHKTTIVARIVAQVGGPNRDKFTTNNIDKQMVQAER